MLVLAAVFIADASPLSPPAQANPLADWSPSETNLSGWQPLHLKEERLLVGQDGALAAFWIGYDFTTNQSSLWGRVRQPGGEWTPAVNISGYHTSSYLYWDASVTPDSTFWVLWAWPQTNQVRAAFYPLGGPWQNDDPTTQPGTSISGAQMAASPDGYLAAGWVDCAGFYTPPCTLNVARRFPGAPDWEPVETIDNGWTNTLIDDSNLYILAGSGGVTVVLWPEANPNAPGEWGMFVRSYDPGSGTWSPPKTTPPISGWKADLDASQLIMFPDNTVIAAWLANLANPAQSALFSSTCTAGSSAWSAPAQISTARGDACYPRLAIGENGATAAIWMCNGSTKDELFANARDPGGAWGTETSISGLQDKIDNWHVGVWPNGDTLVVWGVQDMKQPPTSDERLYWSLRPANGIWGGGGQGHLGDWVEHTHGSDLALGNDGSAVLVWGIKGTSGFYSVQAATWPPGGPWEPPTSISGDYAGAYVLEKGLTIGMEGQPVGVVWRADSNVGSDEAILFNEQNFPPPSPEPTPTPTTGPSPTPTSGPPPPGGVQVYLPLVLK
jgi:hypothetical protein